MEVNSLRCHKCNGFLSVPPIVSIGSNKYICGRCRTSPFEETTNPVVERQTLFEALATKFEFPCIYKARGCKVILKWNDVFEHETSCTWKPSGDSEGPSKQELAHIGVSLHLVKCFFCEWEDVITCYFEHVIESHRNRFLDIPEVKLSNPQATICEFYESSGNVVALTFLFDERKNSYYCQVYTDFSKRKSLEYKLKIYDEHKQRDMSFGPLHSNYLPDTVLPKSGIEIKLSVISNILKPAKFGIEFVDNETGNLEDNKLSIPKCTACKHYLTPPVFSCHEDHKYCNCCLETNDLCTFIKRRNFVIETLLYGARYKCEYPMCTFVGTCYSYDVHKRNCAFKNIECPVKDCFTKSIFRIPHLLRNHLISETNRFIALSTENVENLIFIFDDEIFSLEIDYKFGKNTPANDEIKFKLICIGTEQFNYSYQLEINCPEFPYSKIVLGELVEPEFYGIVSNTEKRECNIASLVSHIFPAKTKLQIKLNISKIMPNDSFM